MLGYSHDEFLGKKLWEIEAFKDVASSSLAFTTLRDNGYTRYEDLPLRSRDGRLKNVEFISNFYLADKKGVIQCDIHDISVRIQAEETVRTRAQELELLYGLSRALADANELDLVLDIVNRYTVENVHVTFCRIALLEGSDLVIQAAYPIRDLDHDLFIGDQEPVTALPYCLRILEGHEPVILYAGDTEIGSEERTALLLDQVHSLCLVPLRVGKTGTDSEKVLGMLMLGEERNEGRAPITLEKIHLIRSVGDQAGSAIRRMFLRKEVLRRLQNISALSEIDRAITSSFDLNITLDTLISQVIMQLDVDAADVLLLNSGSQTLEFFCGQGFRTKTIERSELRLGQSNAGRAALEGVLVQVSNLQDPSNELFTRLLVDENFVNYFGVPLIAKGQVKGVLEIFHRTPFKPDDEWLGFLKSMAEQAAIAIDNAMLFDSLARSNMELSQAYDDTIEGWSRALDLRDKETEGHSLRVAENTVILARGFGLGKDELEQVRWGALLHDIGKMGVPDTILLKPHALTDEEWELMKRHPSLAYEMLSPIRYLSLALDIPYCHHEKWDGSGYPRGLIGEQIPLAARIFAVIDVWDALRSARPYRAAWPEEEVLAFIKSLGGSHFDPQVVKVFFESELLDGSAPPAGSLES
jgi:putative nucleotidyltransferase with HDIG domain